VRIIRSPEEIQRDILLVKSEIWEIPGTEEVVWSASHPCGWFSQGRAENLMAAYAEIERQVSEAAQEDVVPQGFLRVIRPHYDGPGLN
jgi:hypothetical protein